MSYVPIGVFCMLIGTMAGIGLASTDHLVPEPIASVAGRVTAGLQTSNWRVYVAGSGLRIRIKYPPNWKLVSDSFPTGIRFQPSDVGKGSGAPTIAFYDQNSGFDDTYGRCSDGAYRAKHPKECRYYGCLQYRESEEGRELISITLSDGVASGQYWIELTHATPASRDVLEAMIAQLQSV